uniref:Fatty acid-binding protein 10-A, liver basic-like n=1 Tax=Gouania willdenowi TaxID=441366 RepID=A0A8C5DYF4_GOUWI
MDFNGTWEVYQEDNIEEFLTVIGAPEMIIKMRKDVKPVFVIEQNGQDFTMKIKNPLFSKSFSFTLGQETEMAVPDGRKMKGVVQKQDGKLIFQTEKFTSVREIQGDEMTEVSDEF